MIIVVLILNLQYPIKVASRFLLMRFTMLTTANILFDWFVVLWEINPLDRKVILNKTVCLVLKHLY